VEYGLHIATMVAIYMVLASSQNLITGYSGLLSLAHAAFYGIGAYGAALASLHLGLPFIPSLLLGGALAGLVGALVNLPALRLHRDMFVVLSFALQVIVFNLMNNWTGVTQGPRGLVGIPEPGFLGWNVSSRADHLLIAAFTCIVACLIVYRLTHSPLGRAVKAVREDEVLSASLGKNAAALKLLSLTSGALLAGIAGGLYAHFMSFIDPTSFTISESVFILSLVIIGGAGSFWGPLVGAAALVVLPEALRFTGFSGPTAANLRQILYAALLLVFMIWRPKGLMGRYSFREGGAVS